MTRKHEQTIKLSDTENSHDNQIVIWLDDENDWSFCITGEGEYGYHESDDYDGYETRHDAAVAAIAYFETYHAE